MAAGLLATVLAAANSAPAEEATVRKWSLDGGRVQLTGKLVVAPTGKAIIRTNSGRWITVQLELLTPADRDYVARTKPGLKVEAPPAGQAPAASAPKVNHLVNRPRQNDPPSAKPAIPQGVPSGTPAGSQPAPAIAARPAVPIGTLDPAAFIAYSEAPAPDPTFKKDLTLTGHRNYVKLFATTADEAYGISCDNSQVCITWNLKTGKQMGKKQLQPQGDTITAVAISSDGKYALAGDKGSVTVYDAKTFLKRFVHEAPIGFVDAIGVSPDSKWMTAIARDTNIHHYPLLGGAGVGTRTTTTATPGRPPKPLHAFITRSGKKGYVLKDKAAIEHHIVEENGKLRVKSGERITTKSTLAAIAALNSDIAFDLKYKLHTRVGSVKKTTSIMASSRMAASDHMIIAGEGDDITVTKTDAVGVEFLHPDSLRTFYFRWPVQPHPSSMQPGPAGNTIYAFQKEKIQRWSVAPVINWPAVRFHRAIRARSSDFAWLDAVAELCMKTNRPFPWGKSPRFSELLRSLRSENGSDAQLKKSRKDLEDWLKKNPDSVAARTLLANQLIIEGWKIRGDGFAASVSPEDQQQFSYHIEQARSVLAPVMKIKSPPADAFENWLLIGKAQGMEPKQALEIADKAYALHPESMGYLQQVFDLLLPRWGGYEKASGRYVAALAKREGGVSGARMYVKMAAYGTPYFHWEDFLEKTGFEYDQIITSLETLSKTDPTMAGNYGLFFASLQKDKENGSKFAAMLTDTVDGATRPPWSNSVSEFKAARYAVGGKAGQDRRGPPEFIRVN